MSNPELLHVIIKTREKVLFDDDVKAVTSTNPSGRFDILPEHENFISLIKDNLVIHKVDGTDQEMKLEQGVLKVVANDVHIYLGIISQLPPAPKPLLSL